MVVICNVAEILIIYLDHFLNFKVLCKGILKLSPLYHLTSTKSQTSAVAHYIRL